MKSKTYLSLAMVMFTALATVLPTGAQAQMSTVTSATTSTAFERIQNRIDQRIERALQRFEERIRSAEERICTRYETLSMRYGIEPPAFCESNGGGGGTPEPAVALEFSAQPQTIPSGATSTLSWSADNAETCLASGGWSGSRVASGTAIVSPATTTNYMLGCANDNGTTTKNVTVTVTGATGTLPTVEISANPLSVASSGTSTLAWTGANADTCLASGGWSGPRATSGTSTVNVATTTTFTLACANELGTTTDAVTVTATSTTTPVVVPSVTLNASPTSVISGSSSTLSWSSNRADTCLASNGWSGMRATSGSQSVLPTATTTYVLACGNESGTTTATATVGVREATTTPEQVPTVVLNASPSTIASGSTSTLSWSSTRAEQCLASGGWSGARATTSGTLTVSPTATTTYALACGNDTGTTTATATVGVLTATSSGTSTATSTATTSRILITEVLYNLSTTSSQGTEPNNEWVELYNAGTTSVDLMDWVIGDATATRTLATSSLILPAGAYAVVTPLVSSDQYWTLGPSAFWILLNVSIGNGLGNTVDAVGLYNDEGTLVDSVGWGSSLAGFTAPSATSGQSIYRVSPSTDTNSASDWATTSDPTPGD